MALNALCHLRALCVSVVRCRLLYIQPGILLILLLPLNTQAQENTTLQRLERAASLIGNNQIGEAEQQLNAVLKLEPNEASALNLLGTIRAKQGKLDEAETLFTRAIRADNQLVGAHMNLAYLYLLKGAPEKTASELKEALRLDPNNADARYKLAWLLFSQGRFDECIAFIEQTKQTHAPSDPLLFLLGSAWLRIKRPDLQEAEQAFRQFLKSQPDNAQGQMNLGYVLLKQKRYAEARELLERSAQKETRSPDIYYYLGLIAQEQNENERAVELFEKAIQLLPSHPYAHIALGSTYLKMKNYTRAQAELETGVKLRPDDSKAHYNLALLYTRQKDQQRAQAEMRIIEKLKSEGKAGTEESETAAPSTSSPR